MSNAIKSIFRQREIERIYVLDYQDYGILYEMQHKKMTSDGCEKRVISDKVIGTYDIEMPMFEIGEEVFLQDIEEAVKIKKRMRNTDGSVVYFVEDKIVETENTRKSYEYCAKKISQFEEFMKYKEEYKYKHKFFNFDWLRFKR